MTSTEQRKDFDIGKEYLYNVLKHNDCDLRNSQFDIDSFNDNT